MTVWRERGRWRLALVGALVCAAGLTALVALNSPATARAVEPAPHDHASNAGRLDPSFGKRGKVLIAADPPSEPARNDGLGFEMIPSPGGKIVVGVGQTIYRFLPDGRPDRAFGLHGQIAIEAPAGIVFQPAGIAVDRLGRVVLAGTSSHLGAVGDPGPFQFTGPPPTWATVVRYRENGSPDQGFGTAGRVDTTLGLAPPEPHRNFVDPSKVTNYVTPAVSVKAVAVDAEDRPVITGGSVAQVSTCYMGNSDYITRAYVTRLTGDGTFDADLTNRYIAGNKAGVILTPTPEGGLFFQAWNGSGCPRGPDSQPAQILKLAPAGVVDSGFGSDGVATLRSGVASDLVTDRRGRVLLLGHPEVPELGAESQEFKELITRLHPNGSLDTSLGHRGHMVIPLREGSSLDALAVDGRSRPLLVGWASRPTRHPSYEFQLLRLTARGQVDRGFGSRGFVRTRFGASSSAGAEGVLVNGRGRILVGGLVRSPRFPARSGFALVRYLGGR